MTEPGTVHVVDDDADFGGAVRRLLIDEGYDCHCHVGPEPFLRAYVAAGPTCIVSDIMMGASTGFDLADALRRVDRSAAILFMTAWPTASGAVDAVRRYGGVDYLPKPLDEARLLDSVATGLRWSARRREAEQRLEALSRREREVLDLLAAGHSNKSIAARLGLSVKTIEDHRSAIMGKTQAASLVDLVALVRRLGGETAL